MSGENGQKRELSAEGRARIEDYLGRYPFKKAALLPVLWVLQEEFGQIDHEAMKTAAAFCEVSPAHVYGVFTFYTLFRRPGTGTHEIMVCSTLPCALRGSEELCDRIAECLGIEVGETTPDGKFTLRKVECLGSCNTAPMAQVNDDYHENLDASPEGVKAWLESFA